MTEDNVAAADQGWEVTGVWFVEVGGRGCGLVAAAGFKIPSDRSRPQPYQKKNLGWAVAGRGPSEPHPFAMPVNQCQPTQSGKWSTVKTKD